MVAFKAVALATVAVLALVRAASAADLLPPPPAPELPPAPSLGAWYLRGDVGVGFNNSVTGNASPNPLDTAPAGSSNNWYNSAVSEAALFDVGVGYQVNDWFRADVTGELRGGSSFSGLDVLNYGGSGSTPQYGDFYKGNLSSEIALLNGYVDLGSFYGASFFFGGGVGVAFNNFYGGSDQGFAGTGYNVSPTGGPVGNSTTTSLAWALMAGVDFKVARHLKFEIGYRYLNYGDFKSGSTQCLSGHGDSPFNCGAGYQIGAKNLSSNDVRLGLRYYFDDETPAPAPEMPLVRKY